MMTSDKLPSVLVRRDGSLSVERVLKMAIKLIDNLPDGGDEVLENEANVCWADLCSMLDAIDRS
jgi:hypothetical protein